jgi:hypothetical protein
MLAIDAAMFGAAVFLIAGVFGIFALFAVYFARAVKHLQRIADAMARSEKH